MRRNGWPDHRLSAAVILRHLARRERWSGFNGHVAKVRLAWRHERVVRVFESAYTVEMPLYFPLHVGDYCTVIKIPNQWEEPGIPSRCRGLSLSGTTARRNREIECVHCN